MPSLRKLLRLRPHAGDDITHNRRLSHAKRPRFRYHGSWQNMEDLETRSVAEWDTDACATWLRHHNALPLARRFSRDRLDGLDLLTMAEREFKGENLPGFRGAELASTLLVSGGERKCTVDSVMQSFKTAGDAAELQRELDALGKPSVDARPKDTEGPDKPRLHRTPTVLRLAIDDIHTSKATLDATTAPEARRVRRPSAPGVSYLGDKEEQLLDSEVLRSIHRRRRSPASRHGKGPTSRRAQPTGPLQSIQDPGNREPWQASGSQTLLKTPGKARRSATDQDLDTAYKTATVQYLGEEGKFFESEERQPADAAPPREWGAQSKFVAKFGAFRAAVSVDNLLCLDEPEPEYPGRSDSAGSRATPLAAEAEAAGSPAPRRRSQRLQDRAVPAVQPAAVPAPAPKSPQADAPADDIHSHLAFELSDADKMAAMLF